MDITQATEIAEQTLYPLLIDEYRREEMVFPQICDVLPWEDRFTYGERIDSLTDVGEPDEVPFGQELPDRAFGSGWKIYQKSRKIGHKMTLHRELVTAAAATGRLPDLLREQFSGQGRRFAQKKEKLIAGVFQKGTLTAGDASIFDGSFPGEADPYPKFIYDGLPFFDTAHTLKHGSGTYSNHDASAPLTLANLEAGHTKMSRTSAVDERGEPIVVMPDTLLVPSGSLEFTASTILQSMLKPGTANNDSNTMQGRYRLLPWRFLTDDTDAWWLLQTAGKRAVRVRDQGEPRIEVYEDRARHLVIFEAFTYFSFAVQDWRPAYCANKAAS